VPALVHTNGPGEVGADVVGASVVVGVVAAEQEPALHKLELSS
jgi:hypothetical protein